MCVWGLSVWGGYVWGGIQSLHNTLHNTQQHTYKHPRTPQHRYRTLADIKGMGLREKLMRNCATEEHRRKITPKAVDLLSRMLCLDPDRRIIARDATLVRGGWVGGWVWWVCT